MASQTARAGAERTAGVLQDLPGDEWTVLSDVRWPGRRVGHLDHVVIGPGGVFVISSKSWSGTVTVNGGMLRQNGRARHGELAATAEAAKAVEGLDEYLLPEHVHPVLCLVRGEYVAERFGEVLVWTTQNVVAMLKSRPEVYTPEQRIDIAEHLEAALSSSRKDARRAAKPRRLAAPTKPAATRSKVGLAKTVPVMAVASLGIAAAALVRPDMVSGMVDRVTTVVTDITSPANEPVVDKAPGKNKRKLERQQRQAEKQAG
jgi:Nuclease-related domain